MVQTHFDSPEVYLSSKRFDSVRHKINDFVKSQIDPIIRSHTKKQLQNYYKTILRFIENDLPAEWIDRFEKLKEYKIDSTSIESFKLRYGDVEGQRQYDLRHEKGKNFKFRYIEKFGEDAWKQKSYRETKFSLESQVARYGEIDGTLRWNKMLTHKLESQQKNNDNRIDVYKNGLTLPEYQERYGIEVGYKKWKDRCDKHAYKVSRQRYIDQYGEELGTEICRYIKKNIDIDRFTELYGDELGQIIFDVTKKNCAITLDKMIAKWGEDVGTQKYESWKKNSALGVIQSSKPYSKSSQELFWMIYSELPEKYQKNITFAEMNGESIIYVPVDWGYIRKVFYADFKCVNCMIEFDGKYWHNEESDKERDEISVRMGYTILRIDYDDFMKNKTLTLKQCLSFIYENAQIE